MADYETPTKWVRPIAERVGGFDLDPCASKVSDHANHNIRLTGGLEADWSEYDTVWVNHPFGRGEPGKWLSKAVASDCRTVVTLSKNDPSTEWFQTYYPEADLWFFPKDRIKFGGRNDTAKFPVVFGVFGEYDGSLVTWFRKNGIVVDCDNVQPREEPSEQLTLTE